MRTITATELARNLRQILDRMVSGGEEIVIERNRQQVARMIPGAARQTALEAMADLYRTLPETAAVGWESDGRSSTGEKVADGMRDPWGS